MRVRPLLHYSDGSAGLTPVLSSILSMALSSLSRDSAAITIRLAISARSVAFWTSLIAPGTSLRCLDPSPNNNHVGDISHRIQICSNFLELGFESLSGFSQRWTVEPETPSNAPNTSADSPRSNLIALKRATASSLATNFFIFLHPRKSALN